MAGPLVGLFPATSFDDIAVRCTQVAGLLFALAYLHYYCGLSRHSLGWASRNRAATRELLQGFGFGVLILIALSASLYLLGIHAPVPGRDYGVAALGLLLLKAVVTGVAVALFEETLFRGALLGSLLQASGRAGSAVLSISLVYAAVHFIDYPPLEAGAGPGWLTGADRFPVMLGGLFDPDTLDAFLALVMLGILLGLMRLRDGGILRCIGLHAGLVAMIKIHRYFLAYREGSGLDFLVSDHDHRLGLLAFLWLAVATLVYYVAGHKRKQPRRNTTA